MSKMLIGNVEVRERENIESRVKNMIIELVMPCCKKLYGIVCNTKTDVEIY